MEWKKTRTGLYYFSGEYVVSSVLGGGKPPGYIITYKREQVGDRYPTLGDAFKAAEEHESNGKRM